MLLVAVLGAAVGGCAPTPPTMFYVLSSSVDAAPPTAEPTLVIGLGPIDLPVYLDRPEIVTREGPNALGLSDFDQWGEPLKENVRRVLAENLALLTPAEEVASYPWPGTTRVDYQIAVNISRFEAAGGLAILDARWTILRGEDGTTGLFSRHSRVQFPVRGTDAYLAIVAAMSACLDELSREIATTVRTLPQAAATTTATH